MQTHDEVRSGVQTYIVEHGLTVGGLAKLAGINRADVFYWLSGRRFLRSDKLCQVLGVVGGSVKLDARRKPRPARAEKMQ